jgi:N-acetylmuramic acid 6-phosphate etherase
METAASHYDLGAFELEALRFSNQDMLLALTVSGKTPWVWGAMRHAWSLGAPIAVVTQQATSEAAQLADIIIAPQTGPEAVAGFESESAHRAAADPDDADHRAGDSRRTGLQQTCASICRPIRRTRPSGR